MSHTTFAENLRRIMDERGETGASIAEKIGVSPSTVIHWANGRRFPKEQGYIELLSKVLNVPEQDLFDPDKREIIAREELKRDPMRYASHLPEIQIVGGMQRLPLIAVGAGAEALANMDLVESVYVPSEFVPGRMDPNHVVVGRILGDSMEPRYHENDIVFFDMVDGRDVVLPDGIYLVRYGDTVQIKTIQFLGNGDINVISFNDAYPAFRPVADLGVDWEIVGKPFAHWEMHTSSRLKEKDAR